MNIPLRMRIDDAVVSCVIMGANIERTADGWKCFATRHGYFFEVVTTTADIRGWCAAVEGCYAEWLRAGAS